MSTKYEQYMDRQTVSPDLHRRLIAMEQEQKKVVRPVRWQRWASLAAALAVVIGLGIFASRQFAPTAGTAAVSSDAGACEEEAQESTVMAVEERAADMDTSTEEAQVESAADTAAVMPDTEALAQYATDYLGDAPSVVHIAAGMTYPEGWKYDHVELHTSEQPYALDIHLTGAGDTDFRANADTAFALIGNMDVVRFLDASGSVLAEYNR